PRRRGRIALGAMAAVVALGLGALLVPPLLGDDTPANRVEQPEQAQRMSSGTVFSAAELETRVRSLVDKPFRGQEEKPGRAPGMVGPSSEDAGRSPGSVGTESTEGAESTESADGSDRAQGTAVPPCVAEGIGRTEKPLGTEAGVYEGRDALLVVLPHPADPSRVDAYVMDSSCVSKTPPPAGTVLLNRTYRR
ncbi:hypothetical protein ACSNOD_17305, partial [Streptomyces sp. URMC 123]